MNISRRTLLGSAVTAAALAEPQTDRLGQAIQKLDRGMERALAAQNTKSGGFPDEYGLYPTGSACGFLSSGIVAALSPQSKFHHSGELMDRMRLAQGFISRTLTPDGNLNLLITNFNSPPDTAFAVHGLASATVIAQRKKEQELFAISAPILQRMGASLVRGGIHTPNHRWVVSAALAQLHEIFGEPAYLKRIDQWLAEGIDIDEDGFTPQSFGDLRPGDELATALHQEKQEVHGTLFEPHGLAFAGEREGGSIKLEIAETKGR